MPILSKELGVNVRTNTKYVKTEDGIEKNKISLEPCVSDKASFKRRAI